jgi:putative membrane-bound dehydrogenase-like protein
MNRYVVVCAFWVVAVPRHLGEAPAAEMKPVAINGRMLQLATGLEIELVAGPPLIERPICADFDEDGRLYVAEAAGTSDKIAEHIRDKPHRVVRLEDTDDDGRFDRKTVFADRMMIPQGSMWFAGSLYVAAPPCIWKLTDTDGDGMADQRVEWFKGQEMMGCANDVRGPYLGPDGWIYWCKGGLLKLTVPRAGQPPFITSANHVFRQRPDGSGFEPVMIGGMDNPVEVAFTPGGERLFTTTQFQVPGTPRTDGLFHAVYGGVYPKDLPPIHDYPWTGPTLLPVLTYWGASAPAGLARCESRTLGPGFENNVVVAHFNYHKVTRHVLSPEGATFRSQDEDLLACRDVDFHPTDVLEDADGSLLVIETGGWYRFCCPSSSLFKPEVLGAIYRVRRPGLPPVDDPRGRKLAWKTMSCEELVRLLGDERPAVRRRAVGALAARGAPAVPAVAIAIHSAPAADARRNAVWAATRIEHTAARAAVRTALTDADESVRQAALHSVSAWRDRAALPGLLPLLRSDSAHNRRAAAEAIGRIGDQRAVPEILKALEIPADRMLEHSLTFALIDLDDREGTAKGLLSANPHTRRAALTALDQMKRGGVPADAVTGELASAEVKLRETAWWIAGRHPEWGAVLVQPLREELVRTEQEPADRDRLVPRLGHFARIAAVRDWLGEQLRDPSTPDEARRTIVRAMAQASPKEPPPVWIAALTQMLASKNDMIIGDSVGAVQALRIARSGNDGLVAGLLRIAASPGVATSVRLHALAAVPGGLDPVEPPMLAFLLSHLKPDQPVADRSVATEVLSHAKLRPEQLEALAGCLKEVGPLELGRLLDAFGRSSEERVGRSLVAALKASPARSSLRVATLRPRLARFGPAVQDQAGRLFAAIEADTADQRAKLESLLASLRHKEGDVRRGHELFHSTKMACSSCHAIAYVGGTVGPALTQIGQLRTEEDLLESLVFPSATLVQGYESVAVATTDGRVLNGVIVKNASEAIVLVTGPDQQVRLARDEIEDLKPSKVSIMPDGLAEQLTPQELVDLLVFLKSCR